MDEGKKSENIEEVLGKEQEEVVPISKYREEIRSVVQEREKWKKDARSLRSQYEETQKALEELKAVQEDAKLSNVERYEKQIQKLTQAVEEKEQRLREQAEKFTTQRITTEALKIAAEHKALKPQVAINAFMSEYQTKVNEQGVVVSQDKDGIERPLTEVMASYFKENDFLVSASVTSGSGSHQSYQSTGEWWKNPNVTEDEINKMNKKQFFEYIDAKKNRSLPSNVKSFVR